MDASYNLRAIILKRQSFREADTKITIYSLEKGKLSLVARGTRKVRSKLSGHLEPFCFSEIMVVPGKRWEYAAGALSVNCFARLKEDYGKINLAARGAAVFDKLIKENEPDKKIFYLLLEFLDSLDRRRKREAELLLGCFVLKLFNFLGHGPELHFCLGCGSKAGEKGNCLDLEKGGLVCKKCGEKISLNKIMLSEEALKIMRLAKEKDLIFISRIKASPALSRELLNLVGKIMNFI